MPKCFAATCVGVWGWACVTRFGSAWRACATIYNPHPIYFSYIFAKNNIMKPKKRINRRRGKSVDEYGNKVKVKLDRKGKVKPSSKYSIDKDTMSRMDMVDEAGKLAQGVMKRRGQIAGKKKAKRFIKKPRVTTG